MNSNINTDKRCILAYTSMYIEPDGKIRPCCVADDFKEELNFNDYDSITEIINAPQFKELRKSMEDGDPLSMCDICYKGNNQLMPHWNNMWEHKLKDPLLSDKNQNVQSLDYLDARFSNLCNFKCRMCGPGLSTTWYEDEIALGGDKSKNYIKDLEEKQMIHSDPVSKFSAKDLQGIEHLNVGGGEPFITADFWKLIDSFTDEQKSKISMYVNTNGSIIKYKGQNIMDKLNKFKEVIIGVSCDGYGKIVEYQRTGFKQKRFDKNFSYMVDYCKDKRHLITNIEYTITNMNVYHIQDFIYYVKDKWPSIGYNGIHFHWATLPKFYAPALAPESMKKDIIKYIANIMNHNPRKDGYETFQYSRVIDESLKGFLHHLLNADIDAMLQLNGNKYSYDATYFHNKIDKLRGDSWKDIVPHMAPIIEKAI